MTNAPQIIDSTDDQVALSLEILKTYEPQQRPYYGCFSGGKDSVVIKQLAEMAQVNIEWHYNVTTIDPPDIYKFIRNVHPDVIWHYPKEHFFKKMIKRGYPTRLTRWCCAEFKEFGGTQPNEIKVTGIRAAESARRAKMWKVFTRWNGVKNSMASWVLNPILSWTEEDVWNFIFKNRLAYCSLYDEGFSRLGCIGCPMGRKKNRQLEFSRWPQYEKAWRLAFKRLWDKRRKDNPYITRGKHKGELWPGMPNIKDSDELFEWWLNDGRYPKNECQGEGGLLDGI